MRRTLLAAWALTAVVGVAACSDSEQEADSAPVEETTLPPTVAPAPVTPDTTMVRDSMRDTTTTTTGL